MPSSGKRKSVSHHKYTSGSEALDEVVRKVLQAAGGSPDVDLLEEIMITVLKMREDGLDRGDIKMITIALKELRYALKVFYPFSQTRKVAIFGSARIDKDHPEYHATKIFAGQMVNHGWMVITGAASGIMHAGHEGAGREHSFGVNIRLPFEQEANEVIADDPKLINFKYFFTRKLIFMRESDATVLFPGGFGTHDEGFETLTLVQTGKAQPRPIVCVDSPGSEYWSAFRHFVTEQLAKNHLIDEDDLKLIHFTHDPKDAADYVVRFFKNYHSCRFIGDRLVVRMKQKLSPAQLDRLNGEFKDILTEGQITQHLEAFEEEKNEPFTQDLLRLSFCFTRRHFARLHELIMALNKD